MTTTILLVDDHQLLREGLRSLLDRLEGYTVVGEAGDGRTGVRLARELRPDLVIMDVSMPELNGIEATRQIVAELPHTRVLTLSMHVAKPRVLEALRAGAAAYVVKLGSFDEVAEAVRRVANGGQYLSPSVAELVLEEAVRPGGGASAYTALTARERQVLQLLAEGKNSKQIAVALDISVRTVDVHRKHVMDKLGLKSVAELTRYALREGLVSDDG